MTSFLIFAAGLAVLTAGSEFFVRGSSSLAFKLGISPLIIGLTLVALGTSAPEMAVSLKSIYSGAADLAVGNVVGSNIFNILLILGISALIIPLNVHLQILKMDIPVMVASSAMLWIFASNGELNAYEGGALLFVFLVYTFFLIRMSRKEKKEDAADFEKEFGKEAKEKTPRALFFCFVWIFLGLGMLVLGARWMVSAAVDIALRWGVSEAVIGLTVVAAGTSLPELATSIVAAIKGERDIAVGNIVGSNILNTLCITSVCALASGAAVPVADGILSFDLPVMVAVSFACLPIFFTSARIERWEGALFLFYYAAYTVYLIMQSTEHAYLPKLSFIMMSFVVPLTALTLIITFFYHQKSGRLPWMRSKA